MARVSAGPWRRTFWFVGRTIAIDEVTALGSDPVVTFARQARGLSHGRGDEPFGLSVFFATIVQWIGGGLSEEEPWDQQVENLLYGRPRAAWWGERDHEEGVVPCPLEPLPGFGPGGGRLSGGTAVAEPPATFLSPFRAATRSSNAVRRGAVGTSKGVGNEWHCRLRRLSLRRRSSSRLPSGHRNRPHHADATLGPQAPGGGASSRRGGHGDRAVTVGTTPLDLRHEPFPNPPSTSQRLLFSAPGCPLSGYPGYASPNRT